MAEHVIDVADFDTDTPLSAFVDFVDVVKGHPNNRGEELTPFLSEGHPLYTNRTANEVRKLRAYAMAALEVTGLPDAAMPFVRESLESSFHPYTVAAAARALRGAARPDPEIFGVLFQSIFNIWQGDRPVSFAQYHTRWPQPEVASGVTEVLQTLAHFGRDAREALPALEQLALHPGKFSDTAYARLLHCIDAIREGSKDEAVYNAAQLTSVTAPKSPEKIRHHSSEQRWPPSRLYLEDQDGTRLQWTDFFGRKPTLVGFFYTRCGNPNKCTRTVFNLARIQEEIEQRGLGGLVRICAVSYDAQFDTPAALRSYGDARNFSFNDDYRMFRISKGFDKLVELMELEVSFAGAQITSHRIELFVLNSAGEIVRSFVRLQSEPETVADALASVV
jgi:protein SCO1/2